ncbi:caltractin-like isoform X2 [Cucurbita maxima]|uniref:Caltractin-like isoform X2 n=1 Tax=Cucurbita maxima TaxID=3661 RepID=A0A6J1KWC6_CUCMA|nr:caltractin-like isoform X2 [Cucurbita maxima]
MTRAQRDTPMSDSERKEAPNSSIIDTKKTPRGSMSGGDVKDTPEYEKQRLSRIAENRKRMEALGLAKLATSFMDSSKTLRKIDRKGKHKFDEDYNPGEDSSNSEDDDSEEGDEGFGSGKVSRSRGMKGKNRGSKEKRKSSVEKSNNLNDEDDDALQQAIKLSLQESGETSDAQMQGPFENVRRKNVKNQEMGGGMKRKGLFTSRMQMNEDELIMNFYCFDESWKGSITVRDLKRVAAVHDFTWSVKELEDMINCFDSDGDAKLSMDDFRRIASRCNMIKESIT